MADTTDSQCQHEHIEVRLHCPNCGQEFDRQRISHAELNAQAIDLPDREAMSLLGSGAATGPYSPETSSSSQT